jgi:hypothetical protein
MGVRLYRVKVFNKIEGALDSTGVYDILWVAAHNIKEVSEKYPKAEEIIQQTNELIILNAKRQT